MKTGDSIRIAILDQSGRRADARASLRVDGSKIYAEITPEGSGGALVQSVEIELVTHLVQATWNGAEFRYAGEICGAILVPDLFWAEQSAASNAFISPSPLQDAGQEDESIETVSRSEPICLPCPREIQALIRNLPVRKRELPQEYAEFLKKAVSKIGNERAKAVETVFGPVLRNIIKALPEHATFEDAFRRLYEVQQEALSTSRTLSATVPIVLSGSSSQRLEAHASGVFLKIANQYFLLTAAHVLDAGEHSELFVGFNGRFVPLSGAWCQTRLPPSQDRRDDNTDIGYCCLEDAGTLSELGTSSRVLGRSDVLLEEPMPGQSLRVCGYPATRVEVGDGVVETTVTSFEGFEISAKEYDQCGLSPKVNIAVRFNQKRMFSPRLARIIPTIRVLNGMSGGGIYVETPDSAPPYMKLLLVGITTTHDSQKSLIIGTRLNAFLRAIHRNRPELFVPRGPTGNDKS